MCSLLQGATCAGDPFSGVPSEGLLAHELSSNLDVRVRDSECHIQYVMLYKAANHAECHGGLVIGCEAVRTAAFGTSRAATSRSVHQPAPVIASHTAKFVYPWNTKLYQFGKQTEIPSTLRIRTPGTNFLPSSPQQSTDFLSILASLFPIPAAETLHHAKRKTPLAR